MNTKHGFSARSGRAPEYAIWCDMKGRCHNPKNHAYKNYGGRGIKVCKRWRTSFALFLNDVGPRPSSKHSLDREDNDSGYKPDNVRWATRAEQSRNSRRNHRITFKGETLCFTDWCKKLGITKRALYIRLQNWPLSRALTEPRGPRGKRAG